MTWARSPTSATTAFSRAFFSSSSGVAWRLACGAVDHQGVVALLVDQVGGEARQPSRSREPSDVKGVTMAVMSRPKGCGAMRGQSRHIRTASCPLSASVALVNAAPTPSIPHTAASAYAEAFVPESADAAAARAAAQSLGIGAVSPGTSTLLTFLTRSLDARTVVEVGTGAGVASLALLLGMAEGTLTSIDTEPEHQATARRILVEAGIPSRRARDSSRVLRCRSYPSSAMAPTTSSSLTRTRSKPSSMSKRPCGSCDPAASS